MLTRREVFAGFAAAALPTSAFGQQRQPAAIRHDLISEQGAADLRKYALAVAVMMKLPPTDPRSWIFQWYIHAVPDNTTKQQELARIFGGQSRARLLAEETWSTCQAHHPGTNSDFFLPWHRSYLICFENTVRSILNDASFMLPYWNYTKVDQRALPNEFRKPDDPVFGALYRADRRSASNAGQPIDGDLPGDMVIDASALRQQLYRPNGPVSGFCREIDRKLHGAIHVRVGNSVGMGSVPWAANDPIFWVHHANIDRLWASWNELGGHNPTDTTWSDQAFVFPNGTGGRAVIANRQVTSLPSVNYTYDQLEPGTRIIAAAAGAPERRALTIGSTATAVAIPPQGVAVSIARVPRPAGVVSAAGRRVYLVLSRLGASLPPGELYRVELQTRGTWRTIGTINFFDAVPMAHGSDHVHGAAPESSFSFDVTDLVAGVARAPIVRITPTEAPEGGVIVSVDKVELVEY